MPLPAQLPSRLRARDLHLSLIFPYPQGMTSLRYYLSVLKIRINILLVFTYHTVDTDAYTA